MTRIKEPEAKPQDNGEATEAKPEGPSMEEMEAKVREHKLKRDQEFNQRLGQLFQEFGKEIFVDPPFVTPRIRVRDVEQ